ncbi:MAG: GGDEF domain-containing protein [Epsilonproteobacteria bacterium]|nr:GGDEF domain-containing protein [Campylobacterota bacterium]
METTTHMEMIITGVILAIGIVAAVWGAWSAKRAKNEMATCEERIEALKQELKDARTYDPVTRTLNYQAFSKGAYILFRLAHRHQWPVSLLVIDVIDLERINLKYGYKAGNAVLISMASAIDYAVRSSDVVGRFEGSKFFVVLQECDEEGVPNILKRIVEKVEEEPPVYHDKEVPFDFRAAATTNTGKEAYLQEMISDAERGLQEAKSRGEKFVRIKSEPKESA